MGFLKKIRKVLSVVTNVLLIGRNKGWWSKGHELPKHNDRLNRR